MQSSISLRENIRKWSISSTMDSWGKIEKMNFLIVRRFPYNTSVINLENMKKGSSILWRDTPADHDYPAAWSYLSLIYSESLVEEMIESLRSVTNTKFKAKDIFRASWLSLLWISNSHVKRDKEKIKKGIALDPILLIRDTTHWKVVIADGYHRLCAVYQFDEDALIPCKIV